MIILKKPDTACLPEPSLESAARIWQEMAVLQTLTISIIMKKNRK